MLKIFGAQVLPGQTLAGPPMVSQRRFPAPCQNFFGEFFSGKFFSGMIPMLIRS